MILARSQALTQMKAYGIVPKLQILDNKALAAYKQSISTWPLSGAGDKTRDWLK